MEEIKLLPPDLSMGEEIWAYRREMLAVGSSMDGTSALQEYDTPEAWLEDVRLCTDPATVPIPGWVAATQLVARNAQGRIVGMLQIRHSLNDFLRQFGGHIGYSVRPSDRGRGYAKEMLRQSLPLCRALGLQRILITCDEENEASRRTILSQGGVYESTVPDGDGTPTQRYWIIL